MAVITTPNHNESLLPYVCSLTLDGIKDGRAPIQNLICICLETFIAAEFDKLLIFQEISFVMFQQILSESARSAKKKEITTFILKLRGLSPRSNYTDRAATAGRRS
jgi:hypothetical protein